MRTELNVVIDTNVLVSAMLSPASAPGFAVRLSLAICTLLASEESLSEAEEVFLRVKFDRFVLPSSRRKFLNDYREAVDIISVTSKFSACRDSRDHKFLELAVDGRADLIISGDDDLLSLRRFHGVDIVRPQQFIALLTGGRSAPLQ